MPGVKRKIKSALSKVDAEISSLSSRIDRYSGAMASEGYCGGYRDALHDVILAMNGTKPERRGYWSEA